MATIADRIRESDPTAQFLPPATEHQIAAAEARLGTSFPNWLRELYGLHNGIVPVDGSGPYLHPIDAQGASDDDLVRWNEFYRDEWRSYIPDYKRAQPEIDWDRFDPNNLLIIGRDNGYDWAIRLGGGTAIITHDVRNVDDQTELGSDLADACRQRVDRGREVHEQLFRGREPYRDQDDTTPLACDVDRLFEWFVSTHRSPRFGVGRIGIGGSLKRAISQRPGEAGRLFIFGPLGHNDEIRIATPDGNLPFAMRLTTRPYPSSFACIVGTLGDALQLIMATIKAIHTPYDGTGWALPDRRVLQELWADPLAPRHSNLLRMADVLCARDDRRRLEDNPLG